MTQASLFELSPAAPPPTRAAGLARLNSFSQAMGRRYAATRNHDYGPDDRSNVSMLSGHIRHRLITEAEVVSAAINAHGFDAAEKFIQEVCWRTYWKGWLEGRPSVWRDYVTGLSRDFKLLGADARLRARYDAALEGQTGIACFDAWVAELKATGYLHNHARMWFASIWIYTLELPWRLGADFFYRHLIDGDAASNTLGWRWVGGLHTAGKTYLARASNINKYSGGRFQMQGYDLAPEAPALGEVDHPAPSPLPDSDLPSSSARTLVLVHDEDGRMDDGVFDALNVVGVVGYSSHAARSNLSTGARAQAFSEQAVADALTRAKSHFSVDLQSLDSMQDLLIAAQHFQAQQIVTLRPHTGPLADQLEALKPQLKAADLALFRVRRPWDVAFHPHADRGFFKLNKAIPKLLTHLNILPPASSAA